MLSNLGACSIFAALSGSSPATCAAIGKMGIPEMMERGYPPSIATGSIAAGGTLGILIPPSITMIVYGIATETSIGRLFIAGILPGLMLTGLFMAWTILACQHARATALTGFTGVYSLSEKLEALPRVLPFLAIIVGRPLCALWRRGDAVRGRRRRGDVLPGAGGGDLPHVSRWVRSSPYSATRSANR